MHPVELEEARESLDKLVGQAAQGEEIVIVRNGKPLAKLTAVDQPKPRSQFGCARGLIEVGADFDAPLPEMEEYTR
jgi:prevent-host-death family protein